MRALSALTVAFWLGIAPHAQAEICPLTVPSGAELEPSIRSHVRQRNVERILRARGCQAGDILSMVLTEDSKVFPYNENFVPMVCALDKPVVVLPAPIVS